MEIYRLLFFFALKVQLFIVYLYTVPIHESAILYQILKKKLNLKECKTDIYSLTNIKMKIWGKNYNYLVYPK